MKLAPVKVKVPSARTTLGVVRQYRDFAGLFRLMQERLGLSNQFIEHALDMTAGHIDKVLGPGHAKTIGPNTFGLLTDLLCIEFHARVNVEQAAKMQAVWERRLRPKLKVDACRASMRTLERFKPAYQKANARAGAAARNKNLSPERRTALARRAAKIRWRRWRLAQRSP